MPELIAAIDDSPTNLLIIEEYLAGTSHDLRLFEDPRRALAELRKGLAPDVILLDRMMPGLDGIQFLREMRGIDRLKRTPVIMQTAATSPRQVAEGLAEGVFFYLQKPFGRDVLVALVRNALDQRAAYAQLEASLSRSDRALASLSSCSFRFRTIEEVDGISSFLAGLYPTPADALLGIRELMLNAVEHGNLAISYEEKTRLNAEGRWAEEIRRRLAQPEFATRHARATLARNDDAVRLVVEDDGAGFDWQRYMSLDSERVTHSHGRGIAMSQLVSFDRLDYTAPGNRVAAVKRLKG